MAVHKLMLHPADPQCPTVKTDMLAECLQSIGLTGEPLRLTNETIYPAGEHFLQLITFLGCSPAINLESGSKDGQFCHIALTGDGEQLQFRADEHAAEPRCPQCRKPETQWRELVHAWQKNPRQPGWSCTICSYTGLLSDLNFRKSAGFGKVFIEIRNIFPHEAMPGEALLASLHKLTGCHWNTLYIADK